MRTVCTQIVVAALVLIALLAVGCGDKDKTASTSGSGQPSTTETKAPTPRAETSALPPAPINPPRRESTTRPTNVMPSTAPATMPATRSDLPTTLPARPDLGEPADPKTANFAGLTAPKPAIWQWQPPSNSMVLMEYVVPGQAGSDQARISISQAGGSIDANIARWKTQFRTGPEGGVLEPKVESLEVDGIQITLVEFAGEYRGMGSVSFTPNQLFITAIVQAPTGQTFIRFVGPQATVEANREAYMEMIKGLREAEPGK